MRKAFLIAAVLFFVSVCGMEGTTGGSFYGWAATGLASAAAMMFTGYKSGIME